MRRLPVRARLTLWYAALLAVALGLFALGLYVGLRTLLYENFEDQMRGQAAVVLSSVRIRDGDPELAPLARSTFENDDSFIRLLAPDGRVLPNASGALAGFVVDPEAVSAAMRGQTALTLVTVANETVGVVTSPVWAGSEVVGVLQVGVSRSDTDEVLRALVVAFGFAAPVVLMVATVGGYLLAGRALAPVAAITDLAAGIGAADLHARLNLELPDDELGRLARTFNGMLGRIEHAFDRQRQFTGDAAHELRTPLSLMRGQVDLALSRPRSAEEYRRGLEELDSDLARLTGLVDTLLSLARSDGGQLRLERSPFDLASTLRLAREQYAAAAAKRGIVLRDESSEAPVVADEDLIIQLLVNLFDNALAHTPAGGSIAAGCHRDDSWVRFWIADTGAGISAEHVPHVFDRFYRVETGRPRGIGGSGLGLTIVRAIVEAHDGTITLASDRGSGTRVEVLLPAGR